MRKKRKWFFLAAACFVLFCLAWFGFRFGLDYAGKQALKKVSSEIESGELKLPEQLEIPQEIQERISEQIKTGREQNGQDGDETRPSEQPSEHDSSDVSVPSEQPNSASSSQNNGNGNATGSQGVDLSYASAITSVASSADIVTAYSTVLACLSAEDKVQIASYLASGQSGEAYSLVASRLTGEAYSVLLGLYYKYLPMVQ